MIFFYKRMKTTFKKITSNINNKKIYYSIILCVRKHLIAKLIHFKLEILCVAKRLPFWNDSHSNSGMMMMGITNAHQQV